MAESEGGGSSGRFETYARYDSLKDGYVGALNYAFQEFSAYHLEKQRRGTGAENRHLLNLQTAVVNLYLNVVRPKLARQLKGVKSEIKQKYEKLRELEDPEKNYLTEPELIPFADCVVYLTIIRDFFEKIGLTKFERPITDAAHGAMEELE